MKLSKKELLKLNLQHFAEEDETGEEQDVQESDNGTEEQEGSDEQSDDKGEGYGEDKRFTQAELEEILKDRLKRERKKAEDKAEQERLKEEGKYKDLYEKLQKDFEDKEQEIAERDRKDSIRAKLVDKKLSAEDIERYGKYVETLVIGGQEIDTAVEEVYGDFVATKQADYGDPSGGFGDKKEPKQKSGTDYGRELFKRVRG